MNEYFLYQVPKDEINEIYNFHYKYTGNKRTKYIWDWEYGYSNPHNSILIAVKVNNKIVATQGMYSIKIAFGNKILNSGKNESLLIDNEYRGRSLSTLLYQYAIKEYAKSDISFLWGFSKKAIIPLEKANFNVFKNIMERTILSINYQQTKSMISNKRYNKFKTLLYHILILAGTLYSYTIMNLSKLFAKWNLRDHEIRNVLKEPTDIISLYQNITKKHPELIYIYQDEEYFNWRIKNSPIKMNTYFLYEGEDLKGYFYIKVQLNLCELTDFVFIERKHGLVLRNKLLSIISDKKFGTVYYTGNKFNVLNKAAFKILKSCGFIKIKGPNHFVIRNFNFKDEPTLLNIRNWYLNDLWSEGI